jgi:hypothetical protein
VPDKKVYDKERLDALVREWNSAPAGSHNASDAQDLAYRLAVRMFQRRLVNEANDAASYLVIAPVAVFQQDFCDVRWRLEPVVNLSFLARAPRGSDEPGVPMLPDGAQFFEVDLVTVMRFLPTLEEMLQSAPPPLTDWVLCHGLAYRKQTYLRNLHRVLLRYSPHHFPVPPTRDPTAYNSTAAVFALCSLDEDTVVGDTAAIYARENQTLRDQRRAIACVIGPHVAAVCASMSEALDANPRYCPVHCSEQPSRADMSDALVRRLHLTAWAHVEQDLTRA